MKLSELQEGTFAKVVGRAVQHEGVLIAPITGRRCVYWRVRAIDELKVTQEIINEERRVPFILDDGSARAVVDPAGSIVGLNEDGDTVRQKISNARENRFLAHHKDALDYVM